MAAEKVTIMVLEVDLQCPCCYKKVKKLLCKFPQIRDQVYDEKKNTVTISVICCSPEKIRDKLCCKGGKVIKSIQIKPPPKPKEPEKPKVPEKPKEPEKPKDPEKPKVPEKPKEPEKPKVPEKPKEPEKPKVPEKPKEPEKPKAPEKPKEPEKPKSNGKPPAEKPAPVPVPVPLPLPEPKAPEPAPKAPKAPVPAPAPPPTMPVVPGYGCPSIFPYPFEPCCGPCSEGRGGGPCYHGYGRPQPCYDNYGYGYGPYCGRRPYYVSRCDEYLNDENTSSCTIM